MPQKLHHMQFPRDIKKIWQHLEINTNVNNIHLNLICYIKSLLLHNI